MLTGKRIFKFKLLLFLNFASFQLRALFFRPYFFIMWNWQTFIQGWKEVDFFKSSIEPRKHKPRRDFISKGKRECKSFWAFQATKGKLFEKAIIKHLDHVTLRVRSKLFISEQVLLDFFKVAEFHIWKLKLKRSLP